MSIVRGIRSVTCGYTRDFILVPETEERMESCLILETQSDNECLNSEIFYSFPEMINLTARIIPHKLFPSVFAERIENNISLGKNNIYETPLIHKDSPLVNKNTFCSKLTLQFENSGEYFFSKKWYHFFKKSFEEYEICFSFHDNVIFEKNFLLTSENIVEKIFKSKLSSHPSEDEKNLYRAYPYAGFYSYGAHPHEIESCIFQINSANLHTEIKLWKLNSFKSKFGFDATIDTALEGDARFIGVKHFTGTQKLSLYEELTQGMCQFTLINLNTEEKNIYKSNNILHVSGTDLLKISFIKE